MIDCPHGERCSGCTQLAVPYPEQLVRKRVRLEQALRPHPELRALDIAPTRGADPVVGYRTRAKWVVGPDGALGLYARGEDHQVVDVPGCRVVPAAIAAVGEAIRGELRTDPALQRTLRAVDLRTVAGPRPGVLVTLVVAQGADLGPVRRAAAALRSGSPTVLGVAVNLVDPASPQLLGPTTEPLTGARGADDVIGDATVRATFGSFVQAHRGQAAVMQRAIADGARGPVLELYGGSGSTGLAIAARGWPVESVEAFAPAAQAAGAAARAAGLPLRAEAQGAQAAAEQRATRGERYDLVVVNPPRRGLEPGVRAAVAALRPRAIAYMSCEPRTLARDLAHLARLGYAAQQASPHDMIPLTDEVETLVWLTARPAPAPEVLYEEPGVWVVSKAAHEAPAALLGRLGPRGAGARVAVGLPEAVSGAVVVVGPEARAGWEPAWQASERRYLALVRGITSGRGSIRRRGRGGAVVVVRYSRRAVWQGHSLIEARSAPDDLEALRRQLASIGHPVLGDERWGHAPSNRYFFEKHGLDRPFLHRLGIAATPPGHEHPMTVTCPLAADLPGEQMTSQAQAELR